jgi:hypothetical protein
MSNIEIQNELFAIRLQLEEEMTDEISIIQEMKLYLSRKNLSHQQMNQEIITFYQNYGINFSLQEIDAVPVPSIQNILNFPLFSFENLMPLNLNIPPNPYNLPQNQSDEQNNEEQIENDDEEDNQEENDNGEEDNQVENQEIEEIESEEEEDDSLPNADNAILQFFNQINNQTNPQPPHVILNQMLNILNQGNVQFQFQILPQNNVNAVPLFQDVVTTLDDKELEEIKEEELTEDIEDICPISMTEFKKGTKVIKLPCSHMFESNCIKEYLKNYNYKCPVCKKEVGKGHANLS